ncbi:MAG: hypothetical protein AAF564_12655 [Bacteroidota bacterium]
MPSGIERQMDQDSILDPDVVEYALYMQGEKLGFSRHEVLEYARAGQVVEHIDDRGNRTWSIDGVHVLHYNAESNMFELPTMELNEKAYEN